jgi:1-deoxy-D-xylulose-5-phosphate reductoisomerase
MKRIAVLGSTGSIGTQTLDVVRWHPNEFQVAALVAGRPSETFSAQLNEFRPSFSHLTSEGGTDRLVELAVHPEIDLLIVATSGTVGFKPTIAALEAGKDVALANKETLIMAGHLVTRAAARTGARLLPIDSEHSAIWQCLQGEEPYAERVQRLVLTASGGAFRDRPAADLHSVTPAEALRHPTWNMGPKITIDSATLMNKGLEVIEAHWLFGLPFDCIDVVIHHQSVIHSMVEFVDGSVKAQLGVPDMRLPIQYAMAHPRRLPAPAERVDLAHMAALTFAAVDNDKYPCLSLAYTAGRTGGTMPTVLNAANEVAVDRFLHDDLAFMDIARLIRAALDEHTPDAEPTLDQVLHADGWAREFARRWTGRLL